MLFTDGTDETILCWRCEKMFSSVTFRLEIETIMLAGIFIVFS